MTVFAKVTGFLAQEIEISAEPQQLFIRGKGKTAVEESDNEAFYIEEQANFVRAIDLPCKVDSSKVVATLDDGTLKITLPKIVMKKAAQADRSQTIISE